MIRQASTEIADTEVIQNKLVQNVWRANINPKLKESVPEEPVRMGLQVIAWVLMLVFFLVVFIYSYLHGRCTTLKSLLSAEDAISNNDGYTCQAVEVPQVFNGQPYYDNAYWWGFGVVSAWGTFRGSNWTAYCGDLMTEVRGVVNFDDQINSTTWTYSFTNTTDGNSECEYTTFYSSRLNSLPNAPGGVLGCSYPNPFSDCEIDDEEVDGADIVGAISTTPNVDMNGTFCPDFILWHPLTADKSPLDYLDNVKDVQEYTSSLCEVWGQDVGIVSKAVQQCEKEECREWYAILSNAISLALGVELAVVLVIVLSFKVSEYYEVRKRQRQSSADGGGGEEKDGDEEKEKEDREREMKTLMKEAGQVVYDAGMTVKSALA